MGSTDSGVETNRIREPLNLEYVKELLGGTGQAKWTAGEIAQLREFYDSAKAALHQAVLEFREICPHEDVIECEWEEMYFYPHMPPAALCVDCGVEEHTWMFRILKPTRKVPRNGPDGFFAYRFGPHFDERLKKEGTE